MTAANPPTATYRELFAIAEFRAIFSATTLSSIGDMLAKVAIAVLVYERTGSPLLSAAAFAVSYLPGIVGGPFLATLADRLPWRRTLVFCDIVRMTLVGVLALPGVPLWTMLLILFAVSLFTTPFDAARIALMPSVLAGDVYVLGVSLVNMAYQASQIIGFVVGGAVVAGVSPRGALLIDALTFGISALLLRSFVHYRPAPSAVGMRTALYRDTADGLRIVFGNRRLRVMVLLAWAASAFGFAHEGLAAPLASDLDGGPETVGLLLAASPIGLVMGGLAVSRFVAPARRLTLVRPLSLLSAAALIPVVFDLPLWTVVACYLCSGVGMSFMLPLNAAFNRTLPQSHRGRAAGVVLAGLMAGQGLAIVLAGALADYMRTREVVALSGSLGLVVIGLISIAWRPPERHVPQLTTAVAAEPVEHV